jgi:hypothetical protein
MIVSDSSGGGGAAQAAGWTDQGSVIRLSTSTDKVGIGTTEPECELTVAGCISAQGTVYSKDLDVSGSATIGGVLTAMGQLVAGGIYDHGHIQGVPQTIVPEFSASNMQTATITGNAILSASNNRQPGATITLRISAYENNMNITWNDQWIFLGSKILVIPTNTYGILSLQCFGFNDSDVIASFALSN